MQTTEQKPGRIEPMVSVRSLRLVTYGLGDSYKKKLFKPVRNKSHHNKPLGGLWSSPVGCKYGWREWSEAESFGDLSSFFETEYTGRTLVIDSLSDLAGMAWRKSEYGRDLPDYEAMAASGIDAIYLTERGQEETRFSQPGLYGYDCECVLVMNPDCIVAAH